MPYEHEIQELVEVSLSAPNTPDSMLTVEDRPLHGQQQKLMSWAPTGSGSGTGSSDDKPHIRFYSVGPSTYQILCPLCRQRADTETVQMSGALGQLSCLLSTLSCCFPIFWLSFVYCCLQSRLKSKRLFCNRCGGHLGYFMRPT